MTEAVIERILNHLALQARAPVVRIYWITHESVPHDYS